MTYAAFQEAGSVIFMGLATIYALTLLAVNWDKYD